MAVQGHAIAGGAGLNMKVVFRTDASLQIGTGHVMRCLTLADALRERGAHCTFVCREHAGHLLELIKQRGYETKALALDNANHPLPSVPAHAGWLGTDWATDAEQTRQALCQQRVDWLIVDHYSLDRTWEQAVRALCRHLMVIDDLADRPHACDLLLDQNLGRTERDYAELLESDAKMLVGPKYALLRPEFAQLREYSLIRRRKPQLKRLLVAMGGVDQSDATGQVLNLLKTSELPEDLHITVVMGVHAPWLERVQRLAAAMPWSTQVLCGVNNMAHLMANSDLAIGAAGGSAWERCALGLPTLVLVLAANQFDGATALKAQGAVLMAEDLRQMGAMIASVLDAKGHSMALKKMSAAAANVTSGDGARYVVSNIYLNHV